LDATAAVDFDATAAVDDVNATAATDLGATAATDLSATAAVVDPSATAAVDLSATAATDLSATAVDLNRTDDSAAATAVQFTAEDTECDGFAPTIHDVADDDAAVETVSDLDEDVDLASDVSSLVSDGVSDAAAAPASASASDHDSYGDEFEDDDFDDDFEDESPAKPRRGGLRKRPSAIGAPPDAAAAARSLAWTGTVSVTHIPRNVGDDDERRPAMFYTSDEINDMSDEAGVAIDAAFGVVGDVLNDVLSNWVM